MVGWLPIPACACAFIQTIAPFVEQMNGINAVGRKYYLSPKTKIIIKKKFIFITAFHTCLSLGALYERKKNLYQKGQSMKPKTPHYKIVLFIFILCWLLLFKVEGVSLKGNPSFDRLAKKIVEVRHECRCFGTGQWTSRRDIGNGSNRSILSQWHS